MLIRRAVLADLEIVVPLFDAYRQFYRQPSDTSLAREFLGARLRNNESVVFLACETNGIALGFTQLYPSFSSASAQRIFILNDLYVIAKARRRGIGRLLLEAAAEFGREAGAARLTLSTALDNLGAQALYEESGWRRDQVFCTYTFLLPL